MEGILSVSDVTKPEVPGMWQAIRMGGKAKHEAAVVTGRMYPLSKENEIQIYKLDKTLCQPTEIPSNFI